MTYILIYEKRKQFIEQLKVQRETDSSLANMRIGKEANNDDDQNKLQLCSMTIPLGGKSPNEAAAVKACFSKFIDLAREFADIIEGR